MTAPQMPNNMQPQKNYETSYGGNISIASILLQQGVITQEVFNEAKITAVRENKSVETVLQETGRIKESDIFKIRATQAGQKFVELSTRQISIDVLNKLNKDVAQTHLAVPFGEENGKVQIAVTDPGDLQNIKFLQVVIGKPLEIFVASPTDIQEVLDKQYGAQIGNQVEEALEDFGEVMQLNETVQEEDISQEGLASAPVSRIVNMMLEYAVKYKASDVHIEPRENKVAIRFRISGVLIEKLTIPKKLSAPVISRIKILSNLKIDEHRLPQDGRFQIRVGSSLFDLRVSIVPSVNGEKIVLRLLERGGGEMRLEDSGLRGYALKAYLAGLKKTEGIVLVTGPTGSGKTHTLASSIKIINSPEVNILTLENPVEIRIAGITQVQIQPEIGLTFASGLRAFLRQDPDIIMVGEIRDQETAQLAVEAALTGHLVLATLHTNSAAGAMPRLIDMEVESFLLASTINVIAAQRLVRVICPSCKEAYTASKQEIDKLHEVLDGLKGFDLNKYPPRVDEHGEVVVDNKKDQVMLFRGKGCQQCGGTGFAGRLGVMEVLTVTEKIASLIMEHRSAFEIDRQAREDGMISMKQDGFLKALEGITTLAEVLRVTN